MTNISPSILAADFGNLIEEICKVKEAKYLHLDIMDGVYVPNISFGPSVIKNLRPHFSHVFDTHLMITSPERYIKKFASAGSDIITVHLEATDHIHRVIQQIKEMGCKAGVSLNPATPLNELNYILPDIDLLLLMSVNPGFGGQKFIPEMLGKIKEARKLIDTVNPDVKLEVDGGINLDNCRDIVEAGTDIIVAGSAIFGSNDPESVLRDFKLDVDI